MQSNEGRCSSNTISKLHRSGTCSLLNDRTGIFGACVEHLPSLAGVYMENCLYDVCRGSTDVHDATCAVFGAFAIECEQYGFHVNWRDQTRCCE